MTRILFDAALAAMSVAGGKEEAQSVPQARPVRTITIERAATGETVSFTGQIRAQDNEAGQAIAQVARTGGRDAVFDMLEQTMRTGPRDPLVEIALTNDPTVTTTGRVREVSPQAGPVARTFESWLRRHRPYQAGPAGRGGGSRERADRVGGPFRGMDVRSQEKIRLPAQYRCLALRRVDRRHIPGTRTRRRCRDRRRAGAAPGPTCALAGGRPMNSFNLSEWAIGRRSGRAYQPNEALRAAEHRRWLAALANIQLTTI